jgi:Ni,Fe-hydrogenase I cytochrome b subunit
MTEQDTSRPVAPFSGRIYGEIVYWGTVLGTVVAIIGTIYSFLSKEEYLSTAKSISGIWQQKSVETIWQETVGHLPQGHWYLDHLTEGSGLTELGLAIGVFMVIPAMIASGIVLFKEKQYMFGVLAFIAMLITTVSMLGLLPLPIG